ncbi:hypothetical protein CXB51_034264 [Gossypium anomalum]|uniref:Uncharacterized protein n=1 Tax=Gossypium anomalum TaxID=47600 RepID=A0A8J5Y510_9ROSI|nr:hypothetical protein CXB51_034264 [Gossypium anomalum]
MEQIGRTGHANYPFKGKMRVDPVKTCTDMLLKSPHSPSPLHRKVYAQAFNHPKLAGDQRSKALSTAQTRCAVHGRVRLLRGGGVTHGAELRAMCGTWGLLRGHTPMCPGRVFHAAKRHPMSQAVWALEMGHMAVSQPVSYPV